MPGGSGASVTSVDIKDQSLETGGWELQDSLSFHPSALKRLTRCEQTFMKEVTHFQPPESKCLEGEVESEPGSVQTRKPDCVLMDATGKWAGGNKNWLRAEERPGPGAPRTARPQFPGADFRRRWEGRMRWGANGPGLGTDAFRAGSKSSHPPCGRRERDH